MVPQCNGIAKNSDAEEWKGCDMAKYGEAKYGNVWAKQRKDWHWRSRVR